MRNHSHRSMKRLRRDGGSVAPSRGRTPRGAKKQEMKPASSSIPSDWYEEKSCSTTTHDRKNSVQKATVSRGHTLAMSSSEQRRPAPTTIVSARSPAPNHKTEGTYHNRSPPTALPTSRRYSPAGRMPRSPMSPWIGTASE